MLLGSAVFTFNSCANKEKAEGAHTHDDGTEHAAHEDTSKPAQQEFNVSDTTSKQDTTGHSHEEGKEHSH